MDSGVIVRGVTYRACLVSDLPKWFGVEIYTALNLIKPYERKKAVTSDLLG